jgi:hypothetical protein
MHDNLVLGLSYLLRGLLNVMRIVLLRSLGVYHILCIYVVPLASLRRGQIYVAILKLLLSYLKRCFGHRAAIVHEENPFLRRSAHMISKLIAG